MSAESSSVSLSTEEAEEVLEISAFKGLEKEDFYHGLLPAEDATKLLQRNGDFLLRAEDMEDGKGRQVCVSIRWQTESYNVPFVTSTKGCTLNGVHFSSSAADLVRQHKNLNIAVCNPRSLDVVPITGIHRQEWELRHDQVTLTKKLGEGAFGEVHLGTLAIAGKTIRVAVKQSKGDVNKEQIQEMMREARLMRQYKHLNIVRFFGVAAEKEPVMIVMEFVGGGALNSYLKKGIGTITPKHKAAMCYDAACGLAYLHEHGCIHRDVAARNCLVVEKTHLVKISDFGLSTKSRQYVMDKNERAPIRWLAPEVMKSATFEQPADTWSYGVLCWEIFADGTVPYNEFTTADLQKMIHEPDFRLQMRADTPKDVTKTVQRCWNAKPSDRPGMKDVAAALLKFSTQDFEARKKKKELKKQKKKEDCKKKKPKGAKTSSRCPRSRSPAKKSAPKPAAGKQKSARRSSDASASPCSTPAKSARKKR